MADLYDRYVGPVFSLVARIIGPSADVEDVVQEVFAQAWQQAGRFDRSRGSVIAWLLNMSRSRAIDRLRARRARRDSAQVVDDRMILQLADTGIDQESAALTKQEFVRLRAAVAVLPPLQRLAIELAYFEGLTQAEIAARLEQPVGTIKTRIHLGLVKLRDAMMEGDA